MSNGRTKAAAAMSATPVFAPCRIIIFWPYIYITTITVAFTRDIFEVVKCAYFLFFIK